MKKYYLGPRTEVNIMEIVAEMAIRPNQSQDDAEIAPKTRTLSPTSSRIEAEFL
jgi:hypothetical protein